MNSNNNNSSTPSGSSRHFVVKAAARVTASGNPISLSDDEDQPILMEAKLREMITSVNQLILSNQELDQALLEGHDDDLLDALRENEMAFICERARNSFKRQGGRWESYEMMKKKMDAHFTFIREG